MGLKLAALNRKLLDERRDKAGVDPELGGTQRRAGLWIRASCGTRVGLMGCVGVRPENRTEVSPIISRIRRSGTCGLTNTSVHTHPPPALAAGQGAQTFCKPVSSWGEAGYGYNSLVLLCSQKKMKRTKHVRFQEEVNVAKETTSQTADTQDTSSVTEVALALAKDVIAAAVQSVKGEAENPIKNIDWVTHGEFTAERGRKQIEQFVLKWEYHSRWVHYTDFLRREDMGHSIFHYIYCVRWSIPTAQIPIAQITAGVYFTIKIHKKKPPDTPIDVSYVFEGQSLVHRPGMIRFREKWLRDIIEAKCILINPNMFQFNSIGIFQNIVGLDF
ncbi:hypothetical protein CB1_000801004 [Camelus ferus]|nr:hypothetical protein CB1_000801004 [Camelus ferus]